MNNFIKKQKKEKTIVRVCQIGLFLMFLTIWETLARLNLINTFIFSSPTQVLTTLINLFKSNNLFNHIYVTTFETLIAFSITTILSLFISILLYQYKILSRIFDPYLTILNSLPKIALGPIIIIWMGANHKSIITMAILISIIVSIQNIYHSFISTDKNRIKLLDTFNANKSQKLFYLIIPQSAKTIINTLKINISMCLIGVVMGEFLTSKAGIGYLILYGSQIFNLNLVYAGILLLIILSLILYNIVVIIENKNKEKN